MNTAHAGARFLCLFGISLVLTSAAIADDNAEPAITLEPVEEKRAIWEDGVGGGFVKRARSFELKLARAWGVNRGGPTVAHDLWLMHAQYGYILNDTWGRGHWYGGNLEVTGLFFGGIQDDPELAYVVGLNGGLRYHFATGGRLNPFLSLSLGVTATDIGLPDLGGVFQFNEQYGAGLRYFLNARQAITLEYYSVHLSSARITKPNHGVNAHAVCVGFTWLF